MIVLYEIGYCSVFQFHFKAAVDVFKPQQRYNSKKTAVNFFCVFRLNALRLR